MTLTILGASLFWAMPTVFILGVLAFIAFSWVNHQAKLKEIELSGETVTAVEDLTSATKVVAKRLLDLGTYTPKDRQENFIASALGDAHYTSIILQSKPLLLTVLLQKLIEEGWEVLREMSVEGYQEPEHNLVLSKIHEDETLPEVVVLKVKTNSFDVANISHPTLDLTTMGKELEVTSQVVLCAGDCGASCKVGVSAIVATAAAEASVTVTHRGFTDQNIIPIRAYSSANAGLIPTTITATPTSAAVMKLSYNITRKKADGKNDTYKLSVEKFIRYAVDTCAPKAPGAKGTRFNMGIVGPANSGKSHLIKALLLAASKAGIQIVKASAGAFKHFIEDESAMVALKSFAERGPTWLVIDEGNGLPEELVAALASTMEGLDSSPNLSVVLATNTMAPTEGKESQADLSNLFRGGRIDLHLDMAPLPEIQWRPLLHELKTEHPEKTWTIPPTTDTRERTLGQVYDMGEAPGLEDIFEKMRV